MKLSGWGRYPQVDASIHFLKDSKILTNLLCSKFSGIAHGMGRSYGDSALFEQVICTTNFNHFLGFDPETGVVHAQAGVTLKEMLDLFVPKGWFLPVTPGTQYVTFGGAIASDVHGKNHHKEGTFCDYVRNIRLAMADGTLQTCSPSVNPELFRATCGGMGLTGIILDAELQLKPIKSAYIEMTTFKAADLDDILSLFDTHESATYSVAWIDALARGKKMGRSLLMLGEHSEQGGLLTPNPNENSIPVDFPEIALHPLTVSLFNTLYYNKAISKRSDKRVPYRPYFYPLDAVLHWNKMYGKSGFLQYQFVLPKASGEAGLKKILSEISRTRSASFLAVLKSFGKGNDNFLSFPKEGYTLALDFPIRSGVFKLLDRLDQLVLDHDGRHYLTKDARMTEATFKQGYPNWSLFDELRGRIGAKSVFRSKQSQRLGI